jgi:hypothetical protein
MKLSHARLMTFANPLLSRQIGGLNRRWLHCLDHESQQSDVLYRMCRMAGIICQPGETPQTYLLNMRLQELQKRNCVECEEEHRRRLALLKHEGNRAPKKKLTDNSGVGFSSEMSCAIPATHQQEAEAQYLPEDFFPWSNSIS